MKLVFVMLDGLGDRPHPALSGATPLEAAATPTMDRFAAEGITGLVHPLGPGIVPGSTSGHMALFGYGLDDLPGRGCTEALGLGIRPKAGLVALRGNFVTLDARANVVDRRAGRFMAPGETDEATVLIGAINGAVDDARFHYHPRMGYRFVITLEDADARVTDADPGGTGAPVPKVQAKAREAGDTAARIDGALAAAAKVLAQHPLNEKRRARGAPVANGVVTRGASVVRTTTTLQERWKLRSAAVAGGNAYRGVAAFVGMTLVEVPGATGLPGTDLDGKVGATRKALADHDFVYLHIKAPDIFGENGEAEKKRDILARIDRALAPLSDAGALVCVTGDHSTPCVRKAHSADPVPVLVHGTGVRVDAVRTFGERPCISGGLGQPRGQELWQTLMDLLDQTKKVE